MTLLVDMASASCYNHKMKAYLTEEIATRLQTWLALHSGDSSDYDAYEVEISNTGIGQYIAMKHLKSGDKIDLSDYESW